MSEWSIKKQLSFVDLKSLCISIIDCPHSTPNWTDEGIVVIRNFNIKSGQLSLEKKSYTDKKTYLERTKRAIPESGDLVITREAPMGEVCMIPPNLTCCLGQRIVLLKVDKTKVLSRYVLLALQSSYVQKQIEQFNKTGSIVSNLNLSSLKQLKIPMVDNQEEVSYLFASINKKIELNNRINAELEAMAKTLYDYWFVQFDFPDEHGKPYKSSGGKMVYNETLKRDIPEGWEDQILGNIANITMGLSPSGKSLNNDRNGTIFYQGSTDFGWLYPAIRQYTTQTTRIAKQDDLLLSVRAPVGEINIASHECCIGRGVAAMNEKNGYNNFLLYVMKDFKKVFANRNSEGTTFGSITKSDLHSLPIAYPKIETIKLYESMTSPIRKKMLTLYKENQELTELRDWLLPMLMNGQVTVN